ncbi:MAG: hypothetical protein IJG83_04460 [Thermoguttaceae bacterium]|nr:hypothetical protein [Thermoguttaceae bacterium]
MKNINCEFSITLGLLLPLLSVICLSFLCMSLSMENRAQRKRIDALERYIVEHTDQANIEVIELLRNIEEED